MIAYTIIVSKGITLLAQTAIFNKDIREWRRQANDQNTWAKFNIFFHRAHREQRKAVTTTVKEGYTVAVKKLWCIASPSRRAL